MPKPSPTIPLEKFSSQAHPELLSKMRELARKEGRLFQALLDEALRAYLSLENTSQARRHVRKALDNSLEKHDDLYRKLALCTTI